jgi:hypothetical protein
MGGDGLGLLQYALVFQVVGDASGPEGVVAGGVAEAGRQRAALDYRQGLAGGEPAVGVPAPPVQAAKQRPPLLAGGAGLVQVGVEEPLRLVVGRHLVVLATLLVQPQPPALALLVVVLHAHPQHGPDPGEAVHHDANLGAVAQLRDGHFAESLFHPAALRVGAVVDGLEQGLGRGRGQHRRLALAEDVPRAAHRRGQLRREDLADYEPIEQHPQGRQVLLDRGLGQALAELLDVAGYVYRVSSRKAKPFAWHQSAKRLTAWAWATRVLTLRMLAVKNSRMRKATASPASTNRAGITP